LCEPRGRESPPLLIGSQANAERFIDGVRSGDPELASYLRIEEWELEGVESPN
jgi:hypothetical protein